MEPTSGVAAGTEGERLVEQVRDRYGRIALGLKSGCCAAGPSEEAVALGVGYRAGDLAAVPAGANLGLGCGAPIGLLNLAPGETVLDLGSGAGLDVFLAAREVGPAGRAIGVDMTPPMLDKARRNAAQLGLPQVEFREGRLEALPVADASVDAVTSNCVINLVPDKAAVFAEIARVLKPGGRAVISDIVLDGALPPAISRDVQAWCGCLGGAAPRAEYFAKLAAAGLGQVEILGDVDYVATLAETAPAELSSLTDRLGVERSEVMGKVRSLTFRARKA
jgi:SAM-dependent methyltransferase